MFTLDKVAPARPERRKTRPRRLRRTAALAVTLGASALVNACSGNTQQPPPLLLSGPTTHIAVTIPAGWHQVIDSGNPIIPEMVAPTTCMGSGEVRCATALARLATLTAPNVQAATKSVEQALKSSPGVKPGASISEGPGKVGRRDGYRHRFTFSNAGATLTAEIAAVPTGSLAPDAHKNHEYSVVLVWVSDKPNAPKVNVIDEIMGSAVAVGGKPPP